jgi:hypothetical protein
MKKYPFIVFLKNHLTNMVSYHLDQDGNDLISKFFGKEVKNVV